MTDHTERTNTIVVCEDDQPTLDLLCEHLAADGFDVLPASSAADALRVCRYGRPDLMLLDLALPDASGLDVLREIREADGAESRLNPALPIIALGRLGGSADRVRGLELGADDHVQKPFGYDELRARIVAELRRGGARQEGPVRVGEMLIDPARRKVMVGDREVQLAKMEFTLLQALASEPTRVFTKDELIRDVWGLGGRSSGTRTLDSHASRLRRKLDPKQKRYVVACWGIGYRLLEG